MENKFSRGGFFLKTYFISEEANEEFGGVGIVIPPNLENDVVEFIKPLPKIIKRIFFIGHIDYEPNLVALEKLGIELAKNQKKVRVIACGRISESNRSKLSKYPNLSLLGYVEDPATLAKTCEVGWGYLTIGTGTQNKVYDYLNWGFPAVVSELVFNGLDQRAKAGTILVDNMQKFLADKVQ